MRYLSKPNIDFPLQEVIKTITILPIFDFGTFPWKPILYVGWTLSFEWLFYLIFGFLILLKIKNKSLFLVVLLSILSFTGLLSPLDNIQFNFFTNPIVWEFCMGVFVANYFIKQSVSKHLSILIFLTGILFYLIIIYKGFGIHAEANSNNYPIYYWQRFFMWGIPSALIVFGAVFIEKNTKNYFNSKILLLLGEASFAIYLIHTMIISFVNKFYVLIEFIPLDLIVIFSVTISVTLGVLYYLIIEKKISKYFNQFLFNKVVRNI